MKITLNLSPAASAHDRYALAWAVPVALAGVVALVFLGRASLREYRDYQGIESQLNEVQKRSGELRDEETGIRRKLEDPQYRDLLLRVRLVNTLIDQKQLSLTKLSARLAGLLPEDARLTSLGLTAPRRPGDDYLLRLGISARNEDAVDDFLDDLEDAPDFKDVSILNQGFEEQSSQGQQVNLSCTARYLPDVDVDAVAEEPSAKKPTSTRKSNH